MDLLIKDVEEKGGDMKLSDWLNEISDGKADVQDIPVSLKVVVDYIQKNGKDVYRRKDAEEDKEADTEEDDKAEETTEEDKAEETEEDTEAEGDDATANG